MKVEKVRARVRVKGLVQGVFFRYNTRETARELGVTGWVRNVPDGSVECVIEGDKEKVEDLIKWCHHGPPGAHVEAVEVSWEDYRGEFADFSVRY